MYLSSAAIASKSVCILRVTANYCASSENFILELSTKMVSSTVIALVVPALLLCIDAEMKTVLRRYESFPEAEVQTDLRDGLVTYIACYSLRDTKSSMKCKITHSSLNGTNELASCNIVLEGKGDGKILVHAFTIDKAIISWYNQHDIGPEYFIRHTIVSFDNCKATEIRIGFDSLKLVSTNLYKYGSAILINDNKTFDIFFESSRLCGDRVCKITYDAQGKRIKGPVGSFVPIDSFYVQAEQKSVNESFVITEVDAKGRIILVKPDSQEVLKEIKNFKDWTYNTVSTSHQAIRICSVIKPSSKANCENYDATGNLKSKINVDVGHEISAITVYNLPKEQFILMTTTNNIDKVYFTKVDSNGKRVGVVESPIFKCVDGSGFFNSGFEDNLQYCGSKLCYSSKHVELVKKCIESDDFE